MRGCFLTHEALTKSRVVKSYTVHKRLQHYLLGTATHKIISSSSVLVVVVVDEVGMDVTSSLESLHQPPLRAAFPVMRTPQEDSLPH